LENEEKICEEKTKLFIKKLLQNPRLKFFDFYENIKKTFDKKIYKYRHNG